MAAGKIIYSPAAVDQKASDIYYETLTQTRWILEPGYGMPRFEELTEANKNVWREKARYFFDAVIPLLTVADTGK